MFTITQNEQETILLAQELAKKSKPGDILALSGQLGSGKTVFARGFCSFFGVTEAVTSPTYVVMKEYRLRKASNGVSKIIHVDSYRIDEADSIGLSDYFQEKNVIILIEWPEKIIYSLPPSIKKIKFQYLGDSHRKISYKKNDFNN